MTGTVLHYGAPMYRSTSQTKFFKKVGVRGEQGADTVHAKDDDYLCRYTIKKYHSEKIVSDDSWEHGMIELLPINTDGYSPVVLDDVENYRVLGVLRHVISD